MVYRGRNVNVSVDAAITATPAPVTVPEKATVDVSKKADMGKVGKYAITGAALFVIYAIVTGKGVIRSGLWGLGAGAALGFLLGGSKSATATEANKITDEVAGTMADEYNKILAWVKSNNPMTDEQKARAAQIVQQLKDSGYALVKKGEQYVASATSTTASPASAAPASQNTVTAAGGQ